jgi:hypothetical protein
MSTPSSNTSASQPAGSTASQQPTIGLTFTEKRTCVKGLWEAREKRGADEAIKTLREIMENEKYKTQFYIPAGLGEKA